MAAANDEGLPPAKNGLAKQIVSAMRAEVQRQEDRFISFLQQIIRANESKYKVPLPISDDGERFSKQTTYPDDTEDGEKESAGLSASKLRFIKVEPADEAETPRLNDSISQQMKALAARKLEFATSSDSESTRSEKKRRAPDAPHPLVKMAKLSESAGTPISQDKADQVDVKAESVDEEKPYVGDQEVELAIFADSERASSYGSRLGNFIFDGAPDVSYKMLPRNKREWLKSMVEQRFPCQKGANRAKYNVNWRNSLTGRRKRTIERLEKLKENTDILLAEGEALSNTGESLDEEIVSHGMEREAFLNNPDEIHYAGRLATLFWPNTGVPPFLSDNNRVEDYLRMNYLTKALDERYPVIKKNSQMRAENVFYKLRKKMSM